MNSLHKAVSTKNLTQVKIMVQEGADINSIDQEGNTPLMLAVIDNNVHMVRYLLTHTVDLYKKNNNNEIALSLSRGGDPEITKMLVIQHVTDDSSVQTSMDDNTQTLTNKLITTLLYKHKRKGWNAQDCVNLRYYIQSLNSQFVNFTANQFESYIRHQETATNDFYGSYPSDDSDSDEELAYHQLPGSTQKKLEEKSQKYQTRGQLDNLFFKRKTGERSRGDIKPINEASSIFDLKQRTHIYRGKNDDPGKIARDLRHLNCHLEKGDRLEEAEKRVETVFYCAQYRGVTHLTSKWNQDSRKAHRIENETGQPQYSASV
ncbi:MAG: ankyrin repeat domain-containing protein, partial [Legionellaceae bacterium]|nr:ankyrin repeat domain-containing protein [Legionellaceae bacterium]